MAAPARDRWAVAQPRVTVAFAHSQTRRPLRIRTDHQFLNTA